MKRRNKIVQEMTRNVAKLFSFYAVIAIEHGFSSTICCYFFVVFFICMFYFCFFVLFSTECCFKWPFHAFKPLSSALGGIKSVTRDFTGYLFEKKKCID